MMFKPLIDLYTPWLIATLCWLLLYTGAFLETAAQRTSAWTPATIEIGKDNGLGETVYGVLQDSAGYIWFGTNSSLIRYNGVEFKRFRFGGSVLLPQMAPNGHIWFLGHPYGNVFSFDGRSFAEHPDNQELFDLRSEKKHRFTSFALDHNGMLITNRFDMLRANKDGIASCTDQLLQTQPKGTHYLLWHGNRYLIMKRPREKPATHDSVTFRDGDRIVLNLKAPSPTQYFAVLLKNGSVLMLSNRSTIIVQPDNSIVRRDMPDRGKLLSAYVDRNENVWILYENGAFRFKPTDSLLSAPEPFLTGQCVLGMLHDSEGNYWFGTTAGVLFLPNAGAIHTIPIIGRSQDFNVINNQLWLLSEEGNIYHIDSSLNPTVAVPKRVVTASGVNSSYDLLVDYNRNVWFGTPLCRIAPPYTAAQMLPYSMKRIVQRDKATIAVGLARGFQIIDPSGQITFASDSMGYSHAIKDLFYDANGTLWIGSNKGLHSFDGQTIAPYPDTTNDFSYTVNCVTDGLFGNLLAGSNEVGVLVIRDKGHIKISKEDGLASNRVQSLYTENDKLRIWVAHIASDGLDCITFKDSSLTDYRISHYSIANGLPSNYVLQVAGFAGRIWLATASGICQFDPDIFIQNSDPPYINITEFTINNQVQEPARTYNLNHDENDVFVSYSGIRFSVGRNMQYRYRLLGLEEEWTTTTNRSQYFFSVPPGEYVFQVSAMNESGVWNPNPAEIHFTITPHFAQTFWFWAGIGLALLLVAGWVVRRTFINQRTRYSTEAQIQELRLKLLGANMNPHFTFNVLNSIQSFMNQKDLVSANEFLARFSHLIRINLESSQQSFVPLEQEIERLETYLSLEKMRFGEKLSYAITVDPQLDLDETTVLAMLVQPYVENAIWHGILPKKSGLVEIIIAPFNTDSYTITVRDNGVGLAQRDSRTQQHRSLSMKLNHERLDLLTRSRKQRFSVEAHDREEAGDETGGTVVTITLPLEPMM